MTTPHQDILEAIIAIQKKQQRCIKCITHILTSGALDENNKRPTLPPVQPIRRRSTHSTYWQDEVRKACGTRSEYKGLMEWQRHEDGSFLILYKRKAPMLAQRPCDLPPPALPPPPSPSQLYTIIPTQATPDEDEIEIADDIAERFHAVLFVKLFLFILLFDLGFEYLTILVIAFFFHVNGVFDPLLNFWRRRAANRNHRRNEPLDRVLRNLEERRNVEREVRIANEALDDMRNAVRAASGDAAPSEQSGSATAPSSPVNGGAMVPPPESSDTQPPGQLWKVLYQTVGMFFGTLLPWWKPDQRYLS
eukprot:Protomagalhaensia_sp_Gyna_25__1462@NODE_1742_length_1573_cov_8_654498_g1430_i0_p1_GENE_NODE_1742_length_1573_cov_8_654498_g1430_i0NODE_1742_length_1573_cov_8_654498_g1430_i0_p1_ORF_typecomplete_len306_score50_34PRIMA1/PF16101_5/2_4e03PRIMA1/PF16101_5/0_51PRIMA1/PF16101_5/2_8e03_NODE_1742_length_1573_cov_8_654498_g1430_i04961413